MRDISGQPERREMKGIGDQTEGRVGLGTLWGQG